MTKVSFFLYLHLENDSLIHDRSSILNEKGEFGTHYSNENTLKRINEYRLKNESTTGELSVKDFFSDYNIDIYTLEEKLNDIETFNEAKDKIKKDLKGTNIILLNNDIEQIRKNENIDINTDVNLYSTLKSDDKYCQ